MKIHLEEPKKIQKAFAGELTNSEGMTYNNDGIYPIGEVKPINKP
jgi:hypothetical protein